MNLSALNRIVPIAADSTADKRESYYSERIRAHKVEPYFDAESAQVFLNLVFTHDVAEATLFRVPAAHGLSSAMFNALMLLRGHGEHGCSQSDLGDLMLVSKANVTAVMDALEERKLAVRRPDTADRRVKWAVITEQGQQLLAALLPEYFADLTLGMSDLSADEKQILIALLTKARKSIQQLPVKRSRNGASIGS